MDAPTMYALMKHSNQTDVPQYLVQGLLGDIEPKGQTLFG
jgi:hypothetical protein